MLYLINKDNAQLPLKCSKETNKRLCKWKVSQTRIHWKRTHLPSNFYVGRGNVCSSIHPSLRLTIIQFMARLNRVPCLQHNCTAIAPHKRGQLHLYKNLIFAKKKWSVNKLIKEGHVRKIILEPCEREKIIPQTKRGFSSATPLLTKHYFLMEGVFWE